MQTLWQDLRYGARMLVKKPGFTAIAVITLALGIGANSAIFSGVSAFVIRPIQGVENPEQLVIPFEVEKDGNRNDDYAYPDYVDYRDQNQTFEGLAAQEMVRVAFGANDQNDVIFGEMVSGNYFDVLRVRPMLGRGFLPEEDRAPDAHPVVVLGPNLWQRRFDADPSIVGKTVTLNGRAFTVIGVAPQNFLGTKWGLSMDFWVPMMMQKQLMPGSDLLADRGAHWHGIIGRLKPGVSHEQATSDLTAIAERLAQAYPTDRKSDVKVIALPEIEGRFSDASNVIFLGSGLAMAAVGAVLLIVCANVANLLLARAITRRREIGIRLALGASRFRLIRQLLTESVMLALLGGALGLGIALWASDLFLALIPVLPYTIVLDFSPDASVVLFTFGVSVLTGIIFGLIPAWQSSKTDIVPVLKGYTAAAGQFSRRFTLRNLLVVVQVALSLVVLVCGGLFVKSLQNAQAIDPGFNPDNAVAMTVTPGLLGYTDEQGQRFYQQLVERAGALPGVASASMADLLPLGDSSNSTGPIVADGQAVPRPGEGMSAMVAVVAPRYFETLQIPLLQGRDFTEFDRKGAQRVIIINETMAHRLWPGEDPVGKRLRIGRSDGPHLEVVGVARDGKYRGLGEKPRPFMHFPLAQRYESAMTLLIRAGGDAGGIVAAARQEIRTLDPKMPLYGVKTMEEHMTYALWGARMGATISSLFGVLALALAALGIYGVIAYSVSQRTKEIGIRMALGAARRDVLKLIALQGLRLALVGIGIGLPVAFAATFALSGLLFGIGSFDPVVFIGVVALLIGTGLLASYIPARRATKVDPMAALRYE